MHGQCASAQSGSRTTRRYRDHMRICKLHDRCDLLRRSRLYHYFRQVYQLLRFIMTVVVQRFFIAQHKGLAHYLLQLRNQRRC